ncbi:unnamed protein product [Adineta ricciae]|uniref:Dolichyl-diphosphooligosaccharide--protein glycosyltransferase subunit 1 n=1 Tax=Adineta ricciae TaxID=249248 RepID=A0A813NJR8_ADIRI|nr:unnamed protein product [Adineta ricciae]
MRLCFQYDTKDNCVRYMPGESDADRDISHSNLHDENHHIVVDRPVITQKSFDKVFIPTAYEDRTPIVLVGQIQSYFKRKCIPSKQCGKSYLKVLFPFLSWLKIYELAWLPNDLVSGLTVAIMQIPQGMAYALLARLPAIMGAIAVISLMTGNVVDRFNAERVSATLESSIANSTANDGSLDPEYAITIATTLALTVGIIHFILCFFRLGFVTSFLSDTFISGYTTGTAVLVFTSQVPDILGLTLKRRVGPLNIVYTYIEIFSSLKKTNIATLVISVCAIVTLIVVKEYLEPFYKKQLKKIKLFRTVQIPIPIELIVIIIGTVVSYAFDLNGRYKVKIVNTIGRGFRKPQVPALVLMPSLIKDALIIAVVSFAICMSLAKIYAKKFKYAVNSNQELAAYGLCNVIGSFFGSFASAASLSRTSVYVNTGGRTQAAALISCAFLLVIILQIGSLFESLPKACLASIIIVALKGLFLQMKDICTIGHVTKLEAIVWIITFLSTVILDVDYGLILGIIVSLIVVILRQFRPRTTILGQYERSEIYKTAKRFSNVHEIPYIKIFRFESPIIYFNADYFRESLLDAVGIDLKTGQHRTVHPKQFNPVCSIATCIIIDCSSISQLDYSGGKIFLQTLKELNDCKYKIYLCNLRYYNYDVLEKLEMNQVCSVKVVATVHDAVHDIQDDLMENNDQSNRSIQSRKSSFVNHGKAICVMEQNSSVFLYIESNVNDSILACIMHFSLFCVFFAIAIVTDGQEQESLFNTKVERALDLVSHLPKETITVTFENRGTKPARYYDYYVEPQHVKDVAYVGAIVKGKNSDDQGALPIKQENTDKTKGTMYRIELPHDLRPSQTLTLEIEVVHVHALRMYPAEITQSERQLVLYKTNAYYYSKYSTETQKTRVTLPTDRAESYTQTPKPVSKSEQVITYGTYADLPAYSQNEIVLHYENNNAFLTVNNFQRWIEVSHWGNIAVEETVDMYHSGAKLVGPFSRLDFQRRQDSLSAVKSFKMSLPASARDIYYRDEIGNVSTSNVREMNDQVELELRPRFPLYGGWNTHYVIGYNVPSYQYLFNRGNQYILKMRLIDHVYDDQLLEQVTVKIVLPEHAHNIEFYPPIYDSNVKRLPNEKHYTYLDTVGRPVIVITKHNALFQHIQDFEIHYTFEKIMLLHEPMLIVVSLFALFCLVIVLGRLNFSIQNQDNHEFRTRTQQIWKQILDNHVKRTSFYQKLDDALHAYKTNKDQKAYSEQRKKLENELKVIQQDFTGLKSKIQADDKEMIAIEEFQKLAEEQRQITQALSGHTEKFVTGKIQKQAYTTEEENLRGKLRDINTQVSTILNQY